MAYQRYGVAVDLSLSLTLTRISCADRTVTVADSHLLTLISLVSVYLKINNTVEKTISFDIWWTIPLRPPQWPQARRFGHCAKRLWPLCKTAMATVQNHCADDHCAKRLEPLCCWPLCETTMATVLMTTVLMTTVLMTTVLLDHCADVHCAVGPLCCWTTVLMTTALATVLIYFTKCL